MDRPSSICPALSRIDRRRLLQALTRTHDARLYRRIRAVTEVAEGEPIAAVAKRALVDRSTVHRWVEPYLTEWAPSGLADAARPGRPRAAVILTSDPRRFGYKANTWTVPLLATHLRMQGLAISARTLRRRIRAARFRWKRPRYVYSERAKHVGAKKGGLPDG